ncbi:Gfo/Idh/MocA family oxidoreductase [Candidatus Poribacteria bacterium]|nr:Gfo/Idh/MocA family oxidoreductase [Candidatus Poribacteria bacterium]
MITIAVIGCGYWGPNLIRNFNELSNCKVLKVCDQKQGRLKFIGTRYPHIELCSEHRDVFNDPCIDAVCLVTPVPTHYALAKEALLAGKNVFVEKPLAYSTDQAKELIDLAERCGKVLMVGHVFEYHPAITKISAIMKNGECGDMRYIDSCRINLGPPTVQVSVIWDLAPHDLSIIFYLTGMEPTAVSAVGKSYLRKGLEDVSYITVQFDNGVLGHVHVSWLSPCKLRTTYIIASQKVIVFNDTLSVEKVKIYNEGIDTRIDADDFGEFQLTYRSGDIHSPNLDNREPLHIECEHFIECIEKGIKPRSDGLSGLRVVKTLEAAQRSMRNNSSWEKIF